MISDVFCTLSIVYPDSCFELLSVLIVDMIAGSDISLLI